MFRDGAFFLYSGIFSFSQGFSQTVLVNHEFNPAVFRRCLSTRFVGTPFWYFDEIDSTNDHVKRQQPELTSDGLVCLADFQASGRGQKRRQWLSQRAENLMFTIVLKPSDSDRIQALPFVAALSVAEAIEARGSSSPDIKWPNDVVIDGKKVAGILSEATFSGNRLERVIIGIGINVNQLDFPTGLAYPAASIRSMNGGGIVNREEFLADLLARFEESYERWMKNDCELIKSINKRLIGYGQKVTLKVEGESPETPCTVLGIDEFGHLAVLTEGLSVERFTYQDVRIGSVLTAA